MTCKCVIATAKNSAAVRRGYELSGGIMKMCDECREEKAREYDARTLAALKGDKP